MHSAIDYKTMQAHWEKRASIRTKPQRLLEASNETPHFFPLSRQPLCLHPRVKALSEEAIHFILIQSAYQFMSNIAHIEMNVVTQITLKAATGQLSYPFPEPMKQDLLTIIIDEAYHAYVANDFMSQLAAVTGVEMLKKSETTELASAIKLCKSKLPDSARDAFELIAVCIAENSITQELIDLNNDKNTHPIFQLVNNDHMMDEGRHSNIFQTLLTMLWLELDEPTQSVIGEIMPTFICEYLKPDAQIAHDQLVLTHLGFNPQDVETILADTHPDASTANSMDRNPVVKNIIRLLKTTGLMDFDSIVTPLTHAQFLK